MLTFIMVISGIHFVPLKGNEVLASSTNANCVVEEVSLASLSENELPTCTDNSEEWLFAGWYKDANCETAYTSYPTEDTAFAKFVPENVLSIKLQLKEGTGSGGDDEKTNLRLVSSVDSLDYQQVGFEVYFDGAQTPKVASTKKVYERIVSNSVSNVEYNYGPKIVDVKSEYFVTATIINIAKDNFDKNYYIRPYWVTLDGTTVYGVNRYVSVNNGISETNVNIPVKMDSEPTVSSANISGTTYDASVAYYDGTYAHINVQVPNRDSVLRSVSKVTVGETMELYRNIYTTHASGDYANPSADTSWYDSGLDEFVLITGADLYGFANIVNNQVDGITDEFFAGKTIYLAADIVLNTGYADHTNRAWDTTKDENGTTLESGITGTSYQWKKIGGGSTSNSFAGTFDGNMHTISGMYINSDSTKTGLFSATTPTVTLKDFKLVNSYVNGNSKVQTGSIVGYAFGGNMQNIYSNAIVNAGGESTGGLFGATEAKSSNFIMNNCWFDGTVTNTSTKIGGLIGSMTARTSPYVSTISNCLNTGSLPGVSSASRWVGGLFGYCYDTSLTLANCLNTGTIGSASTNASQKSTQFSLIGNYSYKTISVSNVYATKQDDFLNYLNQGGTVVANTDSSVVASADITGVKALTATTKNLFTYVTDTTTYANESSWAIVPEKTPVLSVFADDFEETYQAIDTSWYCSEHTTFVLEDEADFYGFAVLSRDANANGFDGMTVKLDGDVTLNTGIMFDEDGATTEDSPIEWLPIGTTTTPFEGTFDGQGYNISGLYLAATGSKGGLFGYTLGDAVIRNFSLENSYFSSTAVMLGSIVGHANGGNFDTIYSSAIVTSSQIQVGGLIGDVEGSADFAMKNCWFDGTVINTGGVNHTGGLIGYIKSATNCTRTMEHCLNTGTVSATSASTRHMGGLVGYSNCGATLTISKCLSAKALSYLTDTANNTSTYGLVGGTIGAATINATYVIQQENLSNYCNGTTNADYTLDKALVYGESATSKMPELFAPVEENGESKVYWTITDTIPVLKDFEKFAE